MINTTDKEETLLLKTDALGRVRMPRERRESILDAFEQSGMSGQAFAARIGVKYPTFATWVQKRRRERGDYAGKEGRAVGGPSIPLLEAVMESPGREEPAAEVLEVETPQGLKLRIASKGQAALAAGLLNALAEER